jgi:hypothetical protein
MPTVVTINCPDVVALIEVAANRLTGGNKTAVVAMAMRLGTGRSAARPGWFAAGLLHVRCRKNGLPSTHPLREPELRGLRELLRKVQKRSHRHCRETLQKFIFVNPKNEIVRCSLHL